MQARPQERRILVSIITVVRNAESVIAQTLQSVRDVRSEAVEYIVVDGLSTDRTLAVIKSFSDCVDVLISEADAGIYDAMNKAAGRASGEFLVHINAGDSILRIPAQELLQAAADTALVSFPVKLSSGGIFRPRAGPLLSISNTLHHQGNFYRKTLFRPYDLRYRTFADFDLNQRLRPHIEVLPESPPVATHSVDGQSHDRRHFHEVFSIVRRNHGRPFVALTWLFFKARGLRHRLQCLFHSS